MCRENFTRTTRLRVEIAKPPSNLSSGLSDSVEEVNPQAFSPTPSLFGPVRREINSTEPESSGNNTLSDATFTDLASNMFSNGRRSDGSEEQTPLSFARSSLGSARREINSTELKSWGNNILSDAICTDFASNLVSNERRSDLSEQWNALSFPSSSFGSVRREINSTELKSSGNNTLSDAPSQIWLVI